MSACVACGPAIEIARSPESRVSMNARIMTVSATRMPSASRRMMRRNMGQASHQNAAAGKSRGGFAIVTIGRARQFESQFPSGLLRTLQIIDARIEIALERRRDQRRKASAIMANQLESALLELCHVVACLWVAILDNRDGIAPRGGLISSLLRR